MRIESAQRITGSVAARRRGNGSGSGDFNLEQPAEPTAGTGARASAPVAALDTLIALQEVTGDGQERRRAVDRGQTLLDLLDALKLDVIAGIEDPRNLTRLRDLAGQQRDHVAEPQLQGVLDEIELRAAVELAKRGL